MQCLKIEIHVVTAVTAVVVMMMMARTLYLLIQIKERKMILLG